MGSVMFLCVVLLLMLSRCFGNSKVLDMECQSAEGVIGQTTTINCAFKTSAASDINIYRVVLKKGEKILVISQNSVSEDSRFAFKVPNKPTLLLSNTSVSDKDKYYYTVYTDSGIVRNVPFNITVTAKFNTPVMSSWPKNIMNGKEANLYCNSSGGYPAGTIRWLDKTGGDWTANSRLDIVGKDELNRLNLSSKLSLNSIDINWESFTCVVFNSKGTEEGRAVLPMKMEGTEVAAVSLPRQTVNMTAAVVVVGSLIVGLLLVLLLRRRRTNKHVPVVLIDPEEGPRT